MALGPNFGRVTTAMLGRTMLAHLNNSGNELFVTQQQLSTGKRILTPSMDALGASEYLRFQGRGTRNDEYLGNTSELASVYNFIDTQIGEGSDLINSLKQIALRESNDGASDAQTRSLSATEVANLQTSLMQIANAQFKGLSVFAGKNTTSTAFSLFGDAFVYNGTQDVNKRLIEDNIEFDATMQAEKLFGELVTKSASRKDLNPSVELALVSPPGQPEVSTPLSALNGGRGVDRGIISVQVLPEGGYGALAGRRYNVDLREANTIADVAEAFNNTLGTDGEPVFDVEIYESNGLDYPQNGSNRAAGLKITAIGEAGAAVAGRNAEIRFVDQPGHHTSRDLGLLTGTLSYGITTQSDVFDETGAPGAGRFAGTYDFDLTINGQQTSVSVTPSGAQDFDDLMSELETAINVEAAALGAFGFQVSFSTSDADGDGTNDTLTAGITDNTGTGSIELIAATGANEDSKLIADLFASAEISTQPAFQQGSAAFTTGSFTGRDLNPVLSASTAINSLFGGKGFQLSRDDVANPVVPQGISISNGALSTNIDLSDLLQSSTATIGDLVNRINTSGVQISAKISEDGDRLVLESKLTGVALKIDNYNGTIASQLGVETTFNETRVADLNDRRGVAFAEGNDFRAITSDGRTVEFDLGEPRTVGEIINAINDAGANQIAGGGTLFTAAAVTERTFESQDVSAQLGTNPSFEVSLNGREPRVVEITSNPATLDEMAAALQSELRGIAAELDMDGYEVRVTADATTNRLSFEIQDESGPAAIDFYGASTSLFGLDGVISPNGTRNLPNEEVVNRFKLTDNTFDYASYQPGETTPTLQNIGTSSVLTDLGLVQSDGVRRQLIGTGIDATTLPAAGTFDVNLSRGPTMNVAVTGTATSWSGVAEEIEDSLRVQLAANNVEGLRISVNYDQPTESLIFEVQDGFGDAEISLSNSVPGTTLTELGLDTATLGDPASLAFNAATASYEGQDHGLVGRSADNIFTTINDLTRALQNNATAAVGNTLGSLESSLDRLLNAQAEAGSKVRRLDLATNRLDRENFQLAEQSSRVMDADLAEAATRLAQQQTLFQAGIQATATILRVSVLDYV